MTNQTQLPRKPGVSPGSSFDSIAFVVLTVALLAASVHRPSFAGSSSDERLLSITRTTIYGALLGGLLGLASALVVRDGYEDDAVRWGVAVGSFAGFAYGVAASGEEEFDDLSLISRLRSDRTGRPHELVPVNRWSFSLHRPVVDISDAGNVAFRNRAEVSDGDLEEERTRAEQTVKEVEDLDEQEDVEVSFRAE